ncbi:MAG: DNA-binding response regulator [Azoarcus sp.]|nr:MAG: DNA-binding response regulator [Azoarcus sp.]
MNIVIVEDNNDLLDDLLFGLEHAGLNARGVSSATALDDLVGGGAFIPDLLILDIGLPGEDGHSIACRMRADQTALGIIMLTARSDTREKLKALDGGADHYLVKPVSIDELVAVIRALGRRIPAADEPSEQCQLKCRQYGVIAPSGEQMDLTALEMTLMRTLAEQQGGPVSRRSIVSAMGHEWLDYDQRRLDTLISRLRRRWREKTGFRLPLETERGEGYRFSAPVVLIA